MNNTEVVTQIAEKSGVDEGTCQQVLGQLEKTSGGDILGKLAGQKLDAEAIADKITGLIGVPKDICIKVINALNDVLSKGLLDKINPFSKK